MLALRAQVSSKLAVSGVRRRFLHFHPTFVLLSSGHLFPAWSRDQPRALPGSRRFPATVASHARIMFSFARAVFNDSIKSLRTMFQSMSRVPRAEFQSSGSHPGPGPALAAAGSAVTLGWAAAVDLSNFQQTGDVGGRAPH